jgi:hypothetical protein
VENYKLSKYPSLITKATAQNLLDINCTDGYISEFRDISGTVTHQKYNKIDGVAFMAVQLPEYSQGQGLLFEIDRPFAYKLDGHVEALLAQVDRARTTICFRTDQINWIGGRSVRVRIWDSLEVTDEVIQQSIAGMPWIDRLP